MGGTAAYGAWINSVTHVLMYSHYLWTSYGLKNPFKKLLTSCQIFQFYTCFFHAICVIAFSHLERELPPQLAWLQFFYHITMVYLFTFKLHWVPALIKGDGGKKDAKCADAKAKPRSIAVEKDVHSPDAKARPRSMTPSSITEKDK